jgi:hypothetical protein
LKPIFKHLFPGIIQHISYFGSKNNPFIWVDISENSVKRWFVVHLKTKHCSEIANPFESSLIYSWIDAAEHYGFFSIIEQGKNPISQGVLKIDLKTGTVFEKMDIFSNKLYTNQLASQIFTINTPSHYSSLEVYFKDFKEFFDKKFNQQIDKAIDYLEADNKLIFSYYLYENTWVNKLKVCNLSFHTLFEDQIESNELMGHHTFQVFENLIIYTKNKNELIILDNE